jgi:hypothetical protein
MGTVFKFGVISRLAAHFNSNTSLLVFNDLICSLVGSCGYYTTSGNFVKSFFMRHKNTYLDYFRSRTKKGSGYAPFNFDLPDRVQLSIFIFKY